MPTFVQTVFRRTPVVELEAESGNETGSSEFALTIGLFQLSMFGVAATIGTGICFVLSQAVPVAVPGGGLVLRAVALIRYFSYGVGYSHPGRHEHVGLTSDVEED